jgi:hypothetical protein
MTSVAAEVVAPKVFEDLPHWDEDANMERAWILSKKYLKNYLLRIW